MKPLLGMTGIFLGLMSATTGRAVAWEEEEHRQVADSAFALILTECEVGYTDSLIFVTHPEISFRLGRLLWEGKTFGEICASSSENDASPTRYQERGRTILQQVKSLSASLIDDVWQDHSGRHSGIEAVPGSWPLVRSAEASGQNVVANYLLHHLIALRSAKIAGRLGNEGKVALLRALMYEAMAQGYLGDAFSAGHLLVPLTDMLSGFHPMNNKHAHDFYRSEGIFVINSRGEVWQTFGDKLLQWYAPTYNHVLEACLTSLRELFLVYYISVDVGIIPERLRSWGETVSAGMSVEEMVNRWVSSHDGENYYSTTKMPTLLRLPMPISATWSVRTERMDQHGIHDRIHFPQLRELGFHDPDLGEKDTEFLFPRAAVPSWLFPDFLYTTSPEELIKFDPNVASVHYVQERDFPPSFAGLLLRLGGVVVNRKGSGSGSEFGLGYGFIDDLLGIQKVSVDAVLMPSYDEARRLLFATNFGWGVKLPPVVDFVEAGHFEAGYAWGLRTPFRAHGFKFGAGLETRTIPLGFTYAGLTVRLMYGSIALERTLRGVFLNLIVH